MNSIRYKTLFVNKHYSQQFYIVNDFEYLSFELDGFKFEGTSFDDFELLDYDNYSKTELEKLSLNKLSCGENQFVYDLCDYNMTVFIPTLIRNIQSEEVIRKNLEVNFSIKGINEKGWTGESEIRLKLNLSNQDILVEGWNFEDVMIKIQKSIMPKYKFNNCFGCNFSDYSPYGSSIFGSMLCFKNQKEKYLKVKNKQDFFSLKRGDKQVQETFVCQEFEIRGNNIGYRG